MPRSSKDRAEVHEAITSRFSQCSYRWSTLARIRQYYRRGTSQAGFRIRGSLRCYSVLKNCPRKLLHNERRSAKTERLKAVLTFAYNKEAESRANVIGLSGFSPRFALRKGCATVTHQKAPTFQIPTQLHDDKAMAHI